MTFPIVLKADNHVSITYKALKDSNGKVSEAYGLQKALKLSFSFGEQNVIVYFVVYLSPFTTQWPRWENFQIAF